MLNLKDYLHLYIGCNIQFKSMITYTVCIGTLTPDNIGWALNVAEELKPILRPLSNMNQQESEVYASIQPQKHFSNDSYIWHDAKSVVFLLSNHFDLFGLIEAGLAIDATKVKEVQP